MLKKSKEKLRLALIALKISKLKPSNANIVVNGWMVDERCLKISHTKSLLIPICVLAIGLPFTYPVLFVSKGCLHFGGMTFLTLPSVMQKERIVMLILAVIYNPIFPIYFGTRLICTINAFALYA